VSVLVIIPAAGSGTRFGTAVPKQFQPLAGKPLVQHVVERFLLDEMVTRIVVAVAEPLLTVVKQSTDDRVRFVAGGATRQESVANALASAPDEFEVVAVHDAVRPFFRQTTFHAAVDARASMARRCPRFRSSTRFTPRATAGLPQRSIATTWWRRRLRSVFDTRCFATSSLAHGSRIST